MMASLRPLAMTSIMAGLIQGCPAAAAAEISGLARSTLLMKGSDGGAAEVDWLNGIRLTLDGDLGPARLTVSYELAVSVAGEQPAQGDTDWLDLEGPVARGGDIESRHRLDRLELAFSADDSIDVNIGRQAVSWGTTLYLTPADPFVPFSPSDTLRDYRRGIDALRLRAYPGALSELDLVVRPSRLRDRTELTVLARALTIWGDWEVSAWAGSLYGHAAAAVGAAGGIADWAVRAEAVVRDGERSAIGRGAIGISRTFSVWNRDLGFVLEYQHDGFGAARRQDYEDLLQSDPFVRGELQGLGRDQAVVQAVYQVHPLWELTGLALWNLNSGSVILGPGFSHSLSDAATLSGSVFAEFGDTIPEEAIPAEAEFRAPPVNAYLYLTWYF